MVRKCDLHQNANNKTTFLEVEGKSRITPIVRILIGTKKIDIVCIHLDSGRESYLTRKIQLDTLLSHFNRTENPKGSSKIPTILIGDFNLVSNEIVPWLRMAKPFPAG